MDSEARTRIAVCDRASSYRQGLGTALTEACYAVRDVDDLRSRPVVADIEVVLFTVRSATDWQVLRDIVTVNRDLKVIALLVDPTPDRHAEALRCGAHGVVAWEALPSTIVTVVTAAIDGMALIPSPVARSIAMIGPPLCDPDWITDEEAEWLKLLARGATIQQLADKVGYSERALYRLLHGLYGRMRVANRTEAILQASRWGLLDD